MSIEYSKYTFDVGVLIIQGERILVTYTWLVVWIAPKKVIVMDAAIWLSLYSGSAEGSSIRATAQSRKS